MYSICQRCGGDKNNHWNVKQAEFHVGDILHWKIQLCDTCMHTVEQAVLAALLSPAPIASAEEETP